MRRVAKSKETGRIRIPFEDRYNHFAFPEPNSGCFIWTGSVSKEGYGRMKATGSKQSKLAHRAAYEYFVGPIPENMELDHKCRVRCCVNPDHLEPVLHAENMRRGVWPSVATPRPPRTHCRHGHALTGDNLVPSSKGWLICRVCHNKRCLRWWRKNREK